MRWGSGLAVGRCLVLACVLLVASSVQATIDYGTLEATGTYQFVLYPNVGNFNPNNLGLSNREGDPFLNLLENFADFTLYNRFSENLSIFLEPRLWSDQTKSADNHYIQYESLPDNFRGDGYMLRAGGNDFKAELWQAYATYRSGNLYLRVGKQNLAWGNDIALRILDQVDSLDVSQVFFFGRGFEEFSQIRIPEWMALVDYAIPNDVIPDLTLEMLASPGTWTPTILPSQGAPFNVLPSILEIRDQVQMGRAIYGAKLSGTYGTLDFTLNFLSRPYSNAIVVPGRLSLVPFNQVPGKWPFVIPLPPPLPPLPLRLFGEGEHPRFYMYGGSLDYPWDWAGAVLRAETAVTSNVPFTYPFPFISTNIITRPQIVQLLAVDRPTYLIPGLDSMFINWQFMETYTAGNLHHVVQNGANIDSAEQIVSVFLQQPIYRKRLSLEFLAVIDTADGKWFQPGVHWTIGDHYEADLFYNSFSGSKSSRFPALFWWADGAWFRFTCKI